MSSSHSVFTSQLPGSSETLKEGVAWKKNNSPPLLCGDPGFLGRCDKRFVQACLDTQQSKTFHRRLLGGIFLFLVILFVAVVVFSFFFFLS